MRQTGAIRGVAVLAILAIAASGLAMAGSHGKCTKSNQECASHMKAKYETKGWSGLDKEKNDDGSMRVLSVVPGSPAEKAGIKAGDVLVSMNGLTLSTGNEAKLKALHESGFKIGDTVAFGIKRGADTSTVNVTLEKIPEAVLADMIERHTKESHQIAKN